MAMVYPMQMLLAAAFTLFLAFPLATSNTTITTSKEEIKCAECTPVINPSPPPPIVIDCPPPPLPPSPPPPLPPSPPPPLPPSPPPPLPPSPPPPLPPSPPPPLPPSLPPPLPCPWCMPCIFCPPPCPGCPPPPCHVCQVPAAPPPPRRRPRDEPGSVLGGAVYSPPTGENPYFPYTLQNPSPFRSSGSSINLELKLLVSITFLLLSAMFKVF